MLRRTALLKNFIEANISSWVERQNLLPGGHTTTQLWVRYLNDSPGDKVSSNMLNKPKQKLGLNGRMREEKTRSN